MPQLALLLIVGLALTPVRATGPCTTPSVASGAWQPRTSDALASGEVRLNGRTVPSLARAAQLIFDGSVIELGNGVYSTPLVIRHDDVQIIGRGHVIFDGVSAQGKGTFVVSGDRVRIENIECRNVSVRDRNGACVRLEGRHLELDHVYFHSSEQGLLSANRSEEIRIRDSRFENLGRDGRAHGVYSGGRLLEITGSLFLAAKSEGHEIKSRAAKTVIKDSVVASMDGDDSRLIDVSNGGELTITGSVLAQGLASVNHDMIGFAPEGIRHTSNAVSLRNNLILLERRGSNRLISISGTPQVDIRDNVIVGTAGDEFAAGNARFARRAEAGLPAYPFIPPRPCRLP